MRRGGHATGVLLLAAALLLALPCPNAWACSCVQRSDAEVYAQATAVFTGTAVAVEGDDPFVWTFSVEAVDKGDVGAEQQVALPRYVTSCGFDFQVGERYQVFAYEFDDRLFTDHCSGSRHLSGDAEAFDPARPETDSRPSPVVPTPAPPPPAPATPLPPTPTSPASNPPGSTAGESTPPTAPTAAMTTPEPVQTFAAPDVTDDAPASTSSGQAAAAAALLVVVAALAGGLVWRTRSRRH